jgi:hypothetical protein
VNIGGGNLTVIGGDYCTASGISAANASTVNIYGGNVAAGADTIYGTVYGIYAAAGGTVNLYGGSVSAGQWAYSTIYGIEVLTNGMVNVYGTNFNYALAARSKSGLDD